MMEKLHEMFPNLKRDFWLVWIVLTVFVLLFGLVIGMSFSSTKTDTQSRNQIEAISMIEKLISMQAELSELKSELKSKSTKIEVRATKRQVRAEPVFGFKGMGGFQEIQFSKVDLYIPRGSVFKARTLTSIKTSIAESFVVAQTLSTFEMDRKRRIPEGTRLIGTARLNPILKGLVVKFDTMVLPSGTQIDDLSLLALDGRAFPELSGIYFSDKGEVYGSALAFGFLSGFASSAQDRESAPSGSFPSPSLKNQVLGGLSTASFGIAENLLKDIQNKAIEYVVLPAGEEIFIVFERKLNVDSSGGLK